MKTKQVVIIGSGVGGSAIGALLAKKEEFLVTLIEKTKFIGGRFATYEKEGFKLDIGCHMLANCDKGPLGKVLSICKASDYVKWCYARRPSPVINFKGDFVKFPYELHKLGFTQEDMNNFIRFQADILSMSPEECDRHDNVSIRDFVSRYVDSDLARSLVGFFAAIYFVDKDDVLPVGEYARCQNEIAANKALGYPVGGTGAVPEAYCRIIEESGGKVMTRKGVNKIIVESGRVKGVELSNGEILDADLVISNASIRDTVLELVGEGLYPGSFVRRLKEYRYSFGTHVVKIALDKPITDQKMIFYIGHTDLMEVEEKMGDENWLPDSASHLMIPIISNLDPESAPEGKQLIFAGGGSRQPYTSGKEVWEKWDDAILASLKIVFPDIEKHILWKTSTSTTAINNLFGEEGSVIGISQTIGQVGKDRPPIIDPVIESLYHCSADTGLHGIGGELAADAALRLYDHLTKNEQ